MWETEGEFMQSCWETRGEFDGNSYELFGKPSAIHGKLLGNAWALFLGNSSVRRGPTTGRTDRHACKIPYKTALPVLCPHRLEGANGRERPGILP